MKPRQAGAPRSFVSPFDRAPEAPPEPVIYAEGDAVSHDSYGLGSVAILEGTAAVTVDFTSGDRRRFTLPCAKLCRL